MAHERPVQRRRTLARRLINTLSHLPSWALPNRNLKLLAMQAASRERLQGKQLKVPEDMEITPGWVVHSLVFSIDEFEALGGPLRDLQRASTSSPFHQSRVDDVLQWVRNCVDRYSEALMPLSFDFSRLPEAIRPAYMDSASVYLSKYTPSFITLTMMSSFSELFHAEYEKLHQAYEAQHELSGNPLRSGFSVGVKLCSIRRREEAQSLLQQLDDEIRRVLEYYHFPGDPQEKILTRVIVCRIRKECWWWDKPPSPTPESLHSIVPESHLAYLQSLGDMLGYPSYVGNRMSLAINDFRHECTPRAYTFYISTAVLPEDSGEDWQLTYANDAMDSLMRWASVQAYLNMLNNFKMKAYRIRSILHTSCSKSFIRTRDLGRFIRELSDAQSIGLALNTLHADLVDHGKLEHHLTAPAKDMHFVCPGGGRSLIENIIESTSRLAEPISKMLAVSVSTASQYLNGQYLESNRRLQRTLVVLSIALLVLGIVQLLLLS